MRCSEPGWCANLLQAWRPADRVAELRSLGASRSRRLRASPRIPEYAQMKLHILVVALLICVPSVLGGTPTPFIKGINAHWKARRHSQILEEATTEAKKTPANPEAFVVLFGYHLSIAGNYEQAVGSLNRLAAAVSADDRSVVAGVEEYRKEFLQQPATGVSPPSQKQLDELHKLFPDEFPVNSLLILVTPRK